MYSASVVERGTTDYKDEFQLTVLPKNLNISLDEDVCLPLSVALLAFTKLVRTSWLLKCFEYSSSYDMVPFTYLYSHLTACEWYFPGLAIYLLTSLKL